MAEDSLDDYLAARPIDHGPPVGAAWCCKLPPELLAQVEKNVAMAQERAQPPRWTSIARWLRANGVADARPTGVAYHFSHGHHVR